MAPDKVKKHFNFREGERGTLKQFDLIGLEVLGFASETCFEFWVSWDEEE